MTDPVHALGVVATVTGKDLLDRLDTLAANLNTLSTRLDDIPAAVHDHETRLRTLEGYGLANHGARLTTLERAQWMRAGATALVAALVASGVVTAVIESARH